MFYTIKVSFYKNKKEKGFLGEERAVSYLLSKNFDILERNLSEIYGEIDIVAFKKGVFHFVEVKSSFINEEGNSWPLEERINKKKINKINKVASSYLERKGKESSPWCIDIIAVYFSLEGDLVDLDIMENVVL